MKMVNFSWTLHFSVYIKGAFLLVITLITVQDESEEGTCFWFLIWTISESHILRICSNIYIWYLADYQSRPAV